MNARNILIVAHAQRADTVQAAARIAAVIHEQGAVPVFDSADLASLNGASPSFAGVKVLVDEVPVA
ncbi:MAG: NAD kinase, partial [Microbacterium gubbeenense]